MSITLWLCILPFLPFSFPGVPGGISAVEDNIYINLFILNKGRVVCSKHFEPKQFNAANKFLSHS